MLVEVAKAVRDVLQAGPVGGYLPPYNAGITFESKPTPQLTRLNTVLDTVCIVPRALERVPDAPGEDRCTSVWETEIFITFATEAPKNANKVGQPSRLNDIEIFTLFGAQMIRLLMATEIFERCPVPDDQAYRAPIPEALEELGLLLLMIEIRYRFAEAELTLPIP